MTIKIVLLFIPIFFLLGCENSNSSTTITPKNSTDTITDSLLSNTSIFYDIDGIDSSEYYEFYEDGFVINNFSLDTKNDSVLIVDTRIGFVEIDTKREELKNHIVVNVKGSITTYDSLTNTYKGDFTVTLIETDIYYPEVSIANSTVSKLIVDDSKQYFVCDSVRYIDDIYSALPIMYFTYEHDSIQSFNRYTATVELYDYHPYIKNMLLIGIM